MGQPPDRAIHGVAEPRAPFEFVGDVGSSQLVATAIHAGHDLRPEVEAQLAVAESTRLREEDPFTDLLIGPLTARVVVNRSRFEVDLNRPRDQAVYLHADQAWGLDLWRDSPSQELIAGSLELYDRFYETLAARLDRLSESGPFVLFDVHSYNHRRGGPDAPAEPPEANPDVNLGTGSLDSARWAPVIDALTEALEGAVVSGQPLDVRENVRFKGGHLTRWIAARYPQTGCALALEFKKTFMDEWTGRLFPDRVGELTEAFARGLPAVMQAIGAER
jgi:N-formylglutamate deformylase